MTYFIHLSFQINPKSLSNHDVNKQRNGESSNLYNLRKYNNFNTCNFNCNKNCQ